MLPAGFVKDLIKKFESGLQHTMPRRHGSVASRPNNPSSKRRSAPPRTVSISALESANVGVVQNDASATDGGNHNEKEGCSEIQTDGDIYASGDGTYPTSENVTKAGGTDELNCMCVSFTHPIIRPLTNCPSVMPFPWNLNHRRQVVQKFQHRVLSW